MYYGQVQFASGTPTATNNPPPAAGNGKPRQQPSRRRAKKVETIKPPIFGRQLHFQGPENFGEDKGKELRRMLRGKYIVVLGDWNMRSVYKDILMHLSHEAEQLTTGDTAAFGGGIPFKGDSVTYHEYHLGWQKPFHAEECRYFEKGSTMMEFVYSYCVYPNLFCQTFAANVCSRNSRIRAPDILIIGSLVGDLFLCGLDFEAAELSYVRNIQQMLTFYEEYLRPRGTQLIWCTTPALSITWDMGLVIQNPQFALGRRWWGTIPIKIQMFNTTAINMLLARPYPIVDMYHLTLKTMDQPMSVDGSGIALSPSAVRNTTHCIMTVVKEMFIAEAQAAANAVSVRSRWMNMVTRMQPGQGGKPLHNGSGAKKTKQHAKSQVSERNLFAPNEKKKPKAPFSAALRKLADRVLVGKGGSEVEESEEFGVMAAVSDYDCFSRSINSELSPLEGNSDINTSIDISKLEFEETVQDGTSREVEEEESCTSEAVVIYDDDELVMVPRQQLEENGFDESFVNVIISPQHDEEEESKEEGHQEDVVDSWEQIAEKLSEERPDQQEQQEDVSAEDGDLKVPDVKEDFGKEGAIFEENVHTEVEAEEGGKPVVFEEL